MKAQLKEKQNKKTRYLFLKNAGVKIWKGALQGVSSAFKSFSSALSFELVSGPATTRERVKLFLLSFAAFAGALFLSGCEMGEQTFPLSIAILSSSGKGEGKGMSSKIVPSLSLAAVSISTLFMKNVGVLYFSVLLVTFILRAVITSGNFNESVAARSVTGFLTAGLVGIMWALVSDFALLSLVSLATLVTVTPVFTFLFCALFDRIGDKKLFVLSGERFKIGVLSALFCLVFACREFVFLGLSASALFSYCITLTASKKYGAVYGGVTGLVLGLACGEGYFAASFGIIGLLAALFFLSDLTALCMSVLLGVVVSVFVGGTNGFLSTVPEILTGFLILVPILARVSPAPSEKMQKQEITAPLQMGESAFLEKISGSFSGLSEVFYAVGDCMRLPTHEAVEKILRGECNKVCASCIYTPLCRGKKEKETESAIKGLVGAVMQKGRVRLEDFQDEFRERCPRTASMQRGINERMAEYSVDKGALDAVNLIAGEYRTVSKLLKNSARTLSHLPENDIELKKRVAETLDRLGIEHNFIKCWGGRNTVIEVLGSHPDRISCSTLELITTLENACKMRLEEPEFHLVGDKSVMVFKRKRAINLECAKSTCSKKGESTSGDTVAFFENDLGKFYSVIADGMGSGREAALTSRLATIFLEKLLTCTDDKLTTVEMLNRMLLSKKAETFTTLDLLEIDLYEKRGAFIKAGACSSYVIRDKKAYRVTSNTPPAGIIDDFVSEETKISVEGGDILVLFSDGVADTDGTLVLLDEELCGTTSPRELADRILSRALSQMSAKDDMSVVVIKVFENL